MIRRMLCLLCAVILFSAAVPASAEEAESRYSYDFDLTFTLNADSFPALMRSRADGYAQLVDRLGVKGNFAWSDITKSFELNAVLYYIDKPSMSFSFRFFGTKEWAFCTSPLMNDAILFFNLNALIEYAIKVKNTLGVPLSYLAFLCPYATEKAFSGLSSSWQDVIGPVDSNRTITQEQFRRLSELWSDQLCNNTSLQLWISALAVGSEAPNAVEDEFANLPEYYQNVTGGSSLTVTAGEGSETWSDNLGTVLFSRKETDSSFSLFMSLPASSNRYKPSLSLLHRNEGNALSLSFNASVYQEGKSLSELLAETASAENGAESGEYTETGYVSSRDEGESYGEDYAYDEDYAYNESDDYESFYEDYGETGDQLYLPDLLLWFSAEATGLPASLPGDSSFFISSTMLGAVYPNFTIHFMGETKKDGSLTFSLCKPFREDDEPVIIFSCSGTVLPTEPRDIPDYLQQDLSVVYNVFSFNEDSLAAFSRNVLPPMIRSLFSFVAEAPTAACQSFLDDLTDLGVLDMLLDQ